MKEEKLNGMRSTEKGILGLDPFADDDVVISGISGRFPLADSMEELKENLFNKRNCIIQAEERWSSDLPGCPDNRMAIMKNLDKFDPEFFKIDAAAANSEDPQNRILLEVSYEAIVDSGYDPEELRGKHIGVFMGESDPDPIALERNISGDAGCKNAISYVACMAANKVSRKFGFTGPSFAIDTACSSSGVALEDAFRRLKAGTIEAAVVGGTSICLDPRSNKSYLCMGILSPTGESCSFDARANGLVKAEAIAAIFIQKKKDARRIYAKIHNMECTAAGYVPEGIFVPSVKAESHLFRKTFERIGMDPSIIDYVEGHGTSTPVGDPTEVNAIDEVFCQNRKTPLLLGGLKSNIGHTEAASAICSIAKVIFVFEMGLIPPNINYEIPNPKCPSLTNGKIKVVTEATPYDRPLACVNNFGFGGVSIHMIMERNRKDRIPEDDGMTEKIPKLVVYAATTEKALTDLFDHFHKNSMSREFFALLNKSAYLSAAVAPYRGFTILKKDSPPTTSIECCTPVKRQVWYILTGMGCQWSGMGLDLMQLDVFAESMRKSAKVLECFGIDLLELLQPNKDYLLRDRHITPAFVTIASIQIALVDLLKSLGLEPDGIVGHSTGELVCSYADGCCSAEETILSAYYRGAAVECTELPAGAMAAVGLTWEEAKRRCPEGVFPACHNAEDSVTISGSKEAVEKFVEQLKSENIFARVVNAYGYAFHCETISAVTKTLRKHLLEVYSDPKPRSKRWLSSSFPEEEWCDPKSQIADANYFCHNLESQVHFREVLNHIPADAITIEIGPHFLLQSILKRAIGNKASYIGLMKRNDNNIDFLLSSIGKLYNLGLNPKVENLHTPVSFPVPRGTPMISPLIKWNHTNSYYVPSYSSLIVGKTKFEAKTSSTESFLLDYCIEGRSLYPATGYICLAWKALAETLNKPMETLPIYVENFRILRATVLNSRDDKTFEVSILNMKGDFEIVEGGAIVSTGKIFVPTKPMFEDDAEYHYEGSKSSVIISGQEMYKELKIHGYEYGPSFQGLVEVNMEGTAGLVNWNNEWISFLDSLLLFFGIIYENNEIKLPRSALSIKIDPTVHAKFVAKMEEQGLRGVPVEFDQHVKKCTAPGVEIRNLKLESAPHRSLSEIMPVVEEYDFVPYHEKSALGSEKTANCETYIQVCCHLAKQVAERLNIKGQAKNIIQSVKLNRNIDVSSYLKSLDEDHVLLKSIQKILGMCDSFKSASEIQVDMPNILTKDILFKAILNEKPLRSLLDVAVENCFGKMKITEWSDNGPLLLTAVQDILTSFSLTKTCYSLMHLQASKADAEGLSERKILTECVSNSGAVPEKLAGSFDLALACLMLDSSENLNSHFQKVCSLVKNGGFVLVVHKHKLTPPELFMCILSKISFTIHSEEAIENMFSEENMTVVSKKAGSAGFNAYLLRKDSPKMQLPRIHVIRILEGKYNQWVGDLKKTMLLVQERGSSDKVVLVAQNSPFNGIIGLVNCLKQEPGGDKIRCIFTDKTAPPFDLKNSFYEEVLRKNLLMNVYMNGMWGSYKHTSLAESTPEDAVLCASIKCTKLGDLSSFKWVESPVKFTNFHESNSELYHVYYASLNFKDVMIATGKILPNTKSESRTNTSLLGMEFSGRDKSGRRIMAMTNGGCFSTAVVGKPSPIIFDVPDHWSLEEAASVPVVYSTCYFALIIKGKLQHGEKVLIHCGAGGIGQAAIRIALGMNCEIFTTVGSSEKRSFLFKTFPLLKPENIGCSRDTSFEEMVMRRTEGQGVDVILNSLADEKLQASVRCLAKHGRFLELGKYDFALNNTLGLRIFLKDVSFHGVNLHTSYNASKKTNQFINRTKELLTEGIRNGVVQPLNTTIFSINDVEKAFRYMGSGKHTGKVLLKVRDEESEKTIVPHPIKVTALKNFCLSSNKSYIIVGGLGGFGIELANWLIQKGAGTVVLTSRHGPSTPYHRLCLKRWKDSGAPVFVSTLNATKKDEAERLLQETATKYGPIGGIFNLAVVLRDAFIGNQTPQYFEEVSAPKAHVTKHLDELTRKICPDLDVFVCFSSISCGKGNAGQTNYGYANSAMERICEQRKRDGLHGLAIQWGIFDEVSLTHRDKGENSVISGVMPQKIKSCLQCLERFLLQDKPVVSSFVAGDKSTINKRPLDILQQMAQLFDINEINPSSAFGEIGLDSLVSVELKQILESYFDVQFTIQEVLDMKLHDVKKLVEERQKAKEQVTDPSKDVKNISLNGPKVMFPTEAIITLNSGKTGDPLFIIHGNDFVHENFRKLSENVSRPVFGLRSTKDTPVRSIKDMAVWHLKQIQKICNDKPIHLVSVSTAANLALEIVLHSENQKDLLQPRIKSLTILDGSMDLLETYTTTEGERKQNASTYEASDLCEFLSAFSDSNLTQLKAQLEHLPTLESRMNVINGLLSSEDKSVFIEAAEFYMRKQNLMRFHVVTEVIQKDITAIEASEKVLPNDLAPVKSLLQQICNGRVMIHRIPGHYEFLTNDNSVAEVSDMMNKIV